MKRLIFTAIGIAAAVFMAKKLCYASDDPCDNCDDCDNCVEREICFGAEDEQKEDSRFDNEIAEDN